ncbi:recombinase family protein [Psychromarinibacter sp. S121]|uniref:recombinase family protein n=1 Tax=Psychromarinibacter sp. S121 TaxID=3415127 RepID=UPI003C7A6FF7
MAAVPKKYVGYVRVSTRRQATEGISMELQKEQLRRWTDDGKAELLDIIEDSSPAGATLSLRPKLQDALDRAQAEGARILVSKVDRLARNVEVADEISSRSIRVFSVAEGNCWKRRLRELVDAAQKANEESSQRQKEANARRRAKGETLGNKNMAAVSPLGSASNRRRAEEKYRELADAIAANPELEDLKWRERSERLNDLGIMNQISRRKRAAWTKGSLRKPWEVAQALLEADRASREAVGKPSPTSAPHPTPRVSLTEARPLTAEEVADLDHIMRVRSLKKIDVRDELKLGTHDMSIWMSARQGWKIKPEVLQKLIPWIDTHKKAISRP